MEKEILRLFKGYLGEPCSEINEEALKYGLLIPNNASEKVVKAAIKIYGKDGSQWNNSFHKSFEKVAELPLNVLVAQQIVHYFTTYGFETLGIYDDCTVYIPHEELNIPELDKDIDLIKINPMNEKEVSERLMGLLTSGIALSDQTVKDVMTLSNYIPKNEFDEIKNREVRIYLYDKYNMVPKNPEVFFRYLLYKVTKQTLKIQNQEMIGLIKGHDRRESIKLLNLYFLNVPDGMNKLSSIFLRNKNLFLAFKLSDDDIKWNYGTKKDKKEINFIINKLRKLADKNHVPQEIDVLNQLTNPKIAKEISKEELLSLVKDITIFRELRILNGISYRLSRNPNIVYKIRNGKSYVTKLKEANYEETLKDIYSIIKQDVLTKLSNKVKGKVIYIPSNVVYTVPTSEKQFNGNFPNGSYIELPRESALVYGIHWNNLGNERVDLDLKQMNESEMFGWDADYRSDIRDILFSGDMTNAPAPNGANELFYVSNKYRYGAFLLTLNMFTNNSEDVPFDFVIAKHDEKTSFGNCVLNPNDIIEKISMNIPKNDRQKVVGFITIGDNIRFYLSDYAAGCGRENRGYSTARRNDITMGLFDYLQTYSKTQLKLNDLLKEAGAIIITNPTYKVITNNNTIESCEEHPADLDLSINAIAKDSLINLLGD